MQLTCVWTALMMTLPPTGSEAARYAQYRQGADTPAPESRTPASVTGTKEERIAEAARSYDNGRFIEAALEFEGLFKDYPQELDFLFNAAIGRFGAGHDAHTVAYTREYLARAKLTPEDRKEAEAQLTEALRKVVTVRVTVRAPAGGPAQATVVAQHVARASADLRPELLFPVKLSGQPAAVSLELDPGAWTLRVEGPGYQQQVRRLDVAPGTPSAQEFTLAVAPAQSSTPDGPSRPRDVPPEVAQKLKLGLAVSGGVLMAAGVVLPIVGKLRIDSSKKAEVALMDACETAGSADEANCRVDWDNAYRLRNSGMAVLGGGVGMLAGGLTWMIKDPRKRRTALIAETAIGSAGVVGGLIALQLATAPFNHRTDTSHAGIEGKMGGHAAAMTLVGFGFGMLTSAAVGLGIQRKYVGSLRAGAMTAPGQAGVLLSGSF